MRDDKFCYFHTTLRRRHGPAAARPDSSTLRPAYDVRGHFDGMEPVPAAAGSIDIGMLEDTASVQIAISSVVNALANNRIEIRRATALLYGLQLAANNCRSLMKDKPGDPEKMLRESIGEPLMSPSQTQALTPAKRGTTRMIRKNSTTRSRRKSAWPKHETNRKRNPALKARQFHSLSP